MNINANISYSESYHLSDGIHLLALPPELDDELLAALDGDDRHEIEWEISDAITEKLREHGVDTVTREWYGEWSAEDIVRDVLAKYPTEGGAK